MMQMRRYAHNRISPRDLQAIEEIIVLARELTGIQLGERHQTMIVSRLNKRIMELNLTSLSEYVSYFKVNRDAESKKLIGLLTTHHTYFFREFAHFDFLSNQALPKILAAIKSRGDHTLRIWVAACSRGQEAYSLAMYLDVHLKRLDPKLSFRILGTDIDQESVAIAKNGVYSRSEIKEIPLPLLGDHWARGTGDVAGYVKAKKSLRDKCHFQVANLLELGAGSDLIEKFDIIFCRNVFIYFNSEQIKLISNELLSRLTPEGFLFIGISETLSGLGLPVGSPGPSVYQHKDQHEKIFVQDKRQIVSRKKIVPQKTVRNGQEEVVQVIRNPIRVLCVDDSSTILALLKQILSKEQGFEVVGVAKNGLEAAKKVAELKPDVLTLDIHMPEQTGVEYLEKNYRTGHPPVIMVTSVSRENAELAGAALVFGASDYVEKPELNNILERGDEIRNKIRCCLLASRASVNSQLTLDRSFQKSSRIERPVDKLRVIALPLSSRHKLKAFFSGLNGVQPPTVILVEGAKDVLPVVAEVLSQDAGIKVLSSDSVPEKLKVDEVLLMDMGSAQNCFESFGKGKDISILVYGDISKKSSQQIINFQDAHVVLEDLGSGEGAQNLAKIATDVVMHTSFAYLSTKYFSDGSESNKNLRKHRRGMVS